ncbi:PXA domain-containing protein [Tricharina praecox]|uniref:PXA domain-containing protein n=1 Tax=Tricharina praecox TaxID=43433 RepID=UPI002220B57A|nr:PXA domain-containing protein [Tricharina praecox]KAI5850601.1 PXA domain-containing protein [Tricharina praecox]
MTEDDDRPTITTTSPPPSAASQSSNEGPSTPASPSPSISITGPSADEESKGATPEAPQHVASPPPFAISLADITTKAVEFLSTASSEQLIAVSIGGVAVLYIVLGKLGLLFVGIVAGAVGHASLSLKHAKKEGSVFSLDLHDWWDARKAAAGENEEEGNGVVVTKTTRMDFSSLPPETAKAMEEFADAVVRDYVRWWYTPILPNDDNFPNSVRNVLVSSLLTMYNRIAGKRGADTFLLFLMSASNTFIVFLRELAEAQSSTVRTYLANTPGSALAQMLDRDLQKRKLRMAADDVLRSFVGKDVLQCEPVRVFLTEILAGLVLEMTVDKCSQPDWINNWLVYLLEEETQPEVLQKIDIGEATAAASQSSQIDKSKRVSRAEEEMSKALEEAKEMNRMIVEEERERKRPSGEMSDNERVNGNENSAEGYIDEYSANAEDGWGPVEPVPAPTPAPRSRRSTRDSFTSNDQFGYNPNTLHRAHISLSNLSQPPVANPYSMNPNEKSLQAKPTTAEYLLEIEPASPSMPGWVVVRKFPDFEELHEVLKRIAAISGADTFRRHHAELPTWRGETLGTLRLNLEGYLNDALHERGMAECEGMKRFLEKDASATPGKTGFGIGKGWPNPAAFAKMGQGALNVLSKAPQGVAEGGKGLFGGMKKAFAVANRDDGGSAPPANLKRQPTDPFGELTFDYPQSRSRAASVMEEPRRNGYTAPSSRASSVHPSDSRRSASIRERATSFRDSSGYVQLQLPASEEGDSISVMSLPPPPCDMPDDFDGLKPGTPFPPIPESDSTSPPPAHTPPSPRPQEKKSVEPLTTQETQFIVDIVFAVLSELYTLSSAWTLRRSLLNVAKSILLRPGNASLENIRVIIQETVIDANTSDEAVAALIRQIRENVFPTPEETAKWVDKGFKGAELREKARRLLMQRGVPEALRSVMGAVASEEALAGVFDALQMNGMARGVVGGVMLEGVRGVCQ